MHLHIKQFKHRKLNILIKRLLCLSVLIICFITVLSCGIRKPPLPPVEKVPQRVAINGIQFGNEIRIVWQMPARNAADGSILNIERADIYRLTETLDAPLSLTEEEFASRSTVIATVPLTEADFALKEKTFTDTLKFAGQPARLRYAIRFVNSEGQKAAFSNFLVIEPSPRIASNPTSLAAIIEQDKITLNWTAPEKNVDGSTPANTLGYNIYRRSSSEMTRRLNERPVNQTTFEDEFFAFGSSYEYFVRTVSNGSNGEQVESVSSDILMVKPGDTFKPNPPDAITIAAAPNNIAIFFAINREKDVAGYKIFRTDNPNLPKQNWTLLTKEILPANTFQDTKIESGKTYYYYIIAVDTFGNESDPSETVSETAF